MLIYDQRNFDLHLTQLNCTIANWATIIHIICRPTQMLLVFATGRPLILIPEISVIYITYFKHKIEIFYRNGFWTCLKGLETTNYNVYVSVVLNHNMIIGCTFSFCDIFMFFFNFSCIKVLQVQCTFCVIFIPWFSECEVWYYLTVSPWYVTWSHAISYVCHWLLHDSLRVIKQQPRFKVCNFSYLRVSFHSS